MSQSVTKKTLFTLLKIIISLGLIFFILKNIELDRLGQTLLNARLPWLGGALILILLNIVVRAKRWQILLEALKVYVPLRELVIIYFIGTGFNNLLPSAVGGDAIRMIELNRYTSRAGDAVTSVFVDRFLGLYGALTLGFITLIFAWRRVPIEVVGISILFFISITALGFFLIYAPLYHLVRRIGFIRQVTDIKMIHNLFVSFQDYNLPTLAHAFAIGLGVNVLLIAINMTIGLALGIKIAPTYYLIFVPLVAMALAAPISVAGFGAREFTYTTLFAQAGVLEEAALALALLVYILGNLSPGLMGGAIYLWRSVRELRLKEEQNL